MYRPDLFAAFFLGAFSGAAGAALGIGGGVIIVPALTLAFRLPMHQAVAASLTAIAAMSCVSSALNLRRGLVNLRLAARLGAAVALGSAGGALAAGLFSGGTLRALFGLLLLAVALLMLPRRSRAGAGKAAGKAPAFSGEYYDPALGAAVSYGVRRVKRASAVSVLAGALGGLLGIGGGIIQVPLMNLVCGVPMKAAAATSNLLVGISAAAGLLVYLRRGQLPEGIAAPLAAGAVLGALLGAETLRRVRSEKLQTAFAALLLIVAVKMLLQK